MSNGFSKDGDLARITEGERFPFDSDDDLSIDDLFEWCRGLVNLRHHSDGAIRRAVRELHAELPIHTCGGTIGFLPDDGMEMAEWYFNLEVMLEPRCAVCSGEIETIFDNKLCAECLDQLQGKPREWTIKSILPKEPCPDKTDPLEGREQVSRPKLSKLSGIPIGTLKRWDWEAGRSLIFGRYSREEVLAIFTDIKPRHRRQRNRVDAFKLKLLRYEVERTSRIVRAIDGLIKKGNHTPCTTIQQS